MLAALAVSALMGLSVWAGPAPAAWGPSGGSRPTGGPGGWSSASSTSTAASSPAQTPFKFPLANGFPSVSNATLAAIEQQAHGSLPNGALPTSIQDTSATTFELIAFNEIFEVAFFTSLITNITNNVAGFEVGSGAVRNIVLNALTAVQAQEELHALGANGILQAAGRTPIQPCEYVFPTDNFDDAIALASKFTDLVLGTLQDALNNFGSDGDLAFLPLIGSVIGQEGEQNGFYRNLGNKIPSALPFLTRSTGAFAFSALNQNFVVSGSCGNIDLIGLPVFGVLNVETQDIQPKSQELTFSITGSDINTKDISVVYINQQNLPITEQISNVQTSGDTVTFTAYFPFDEDLLNGLTIAAVVSGTGSFASADAVANATLFGPGLIEIN